ncbi:Rab geranylgeranyltransferase [Sorochytrium milnesiophthora]
MHSVKKGSAQALAVTKSIAPQSELLSRLFDAKSQKVYNDETLELAKTVLVANPDFYTAWNFRRNALIFRFDTNDGQDRLQVQPTLQQELVWLTKTIMPAAPKSYGAWIHRKWCLTTLQQHLADKTAGKGIQELWQGELGLINKFLDIDARNFHAWNYRHYVVEKLKEAQCSTDDVHQVIRSEFAYTGSKIAQSTVNYSAWHYRSTLIEEIARHKDLLASVLESPASTDQSSPLDCLIQQESELIHNAIFTEPSDQSSWLHLRWLYQFATRNTNDHTALLRRELEVVQELRDMEPDSILTLSTLRWLLQQARGMLVSHPEQDARVAAITGQFASMQELSRAIYNLSHKLSELDTFRANYYLET